MTTRLPCRLLAAALAALALSAVPGRADIVTPPALGPGDQFRVVFLSSADRDGLSPNIADYDQFITNLAVAAGLDTYFGDPVTWQVLGSTRSVPAISRVPLTSPGLYQLTGLKVADSGADLWDGTIDAPIILTDLLTARDDVLVYTGTLQDGSASFDAPLGGGPVSEVVVGLAEIVFTNSAWVNIGEVNGFPQRALYGVSSVLTVPQLAAVPEPASLTLLGLGVAGLLGYRLRRRDG